MLNTELKKNPPKRLFTLKRIDLEKHISIEASQEIEKICAPLFQAFDIKYFRYLKLYHNGERILLCNSSDCIRYIYEEGNYARLWFDGNFPQFLKAGWQDRAVSLLLDQRDESQEIHEELNTILKFQHGCTYIHKAKTYDEIYIFDALHPNIYYINKQVLIKFIYFFKTQARKFLRAAEDDILYFPIQQQPIPNHTLTDQFLKTIPIDRYYLGEEFENAYLTQKEMTCLHWMLLGKTAEETAMIENNALKTVQYHLENIKLKLKCQKQTQIIKLVFELGLG